MVKKDLVNLKLYNLESFGTLPTLAQLNFKDVEITKTNELINPIKSQHSSLRSSLNQLSINNQLTKVSSVKDEVTRCNPLLFGLSNFFLPNHLIIKSELNTKTKSW